MGLDRQRADGVERPHYRRGLLAGLAVSAITAIPAARESWLVALGTLAFSLVCMLLVLGTMRVLWRPQRRPD